MEVQDKFEDNLKKLEEIVKKMESDDINLDESINMFEEGIALSKKCTNKLDEAEKKINILLKDSQGNISEEKFDPKEEN